MDDFLKLGEFLLELVKAKSQVVERERFEQRFQAVCDAIGDEGENRAGEKERDEDEIPLFHGGKARGD